MSKPNQPQFAQAPDGSWHPIPGAPPPKKKDVSIGQVIALVAILGFAGLFVLAAVTGNKQPAATSTAPGTTLPPTTVAPLTPEQIDAEVASEVKRACAEAVLTRDTPNIIFKEWPGKNVDEIKLATIVCTQQARDAEAADTVANAKTPDVDAIVKNPAAYDGQQFVMVVKVTQSDGATGPCIFRGVWDNTVHQYDFEYKGDNAIFVGGNGRDDCPTVNGVDQDDVARVWVKSRGKSDYDTQIGGSTTAPTFQVVKSEILQKL